MEHGTCDYCGASLLLLRAGARFCSPKHRVYYSRRPKLPPEMTETARWVRRTATKRPISVTGRPASSTNPETWATFEKAEQSRAGAGLGFVLGSGIGCIDLDHCFIDGQLADWAQAILDRCPPTYTEVSQSGEGLHIFGFLPEAAGRNIRDGSRNIEFYSAGRYIAVTGTRYGRSPSALADISGVIAKLL